jgi:hypothetical protein
MHLIRYVLLWRRSYCPRLLGVAQEGKPEFSIAIHGPESAKVGTYVVVDILVTNISKHVIAFDDADVPALGEANFSVDVFDAQGKLAPRTMVGKARRGEKPSPGESEIGFTGNDIQRNLKPGETLKETVAVSKLYDIKPGVYNIEVSRPDYQAGHPVTQYKPGDSDLNKPVPLSPVRCEHASPKTKGDRKVDTITLTVVPE